MDFLIIPFLATQFLYSLITQFCYEGKHENALIVLNSIKIVPENQNFVYFHKGYCHFKLNHKIESIDNLSRIVEWFGEPPAERQWSLAFLMIEEAKTWKNNDLGDISRKMDVIKDRLVNGDAGKGTQTKQKEVTDWLDKKIAELENKKNQPKSDKNDQSDQKQQKNPLQDSQIHGDSGPGEVSPKKMGEIISVWGKLPEKERSRYLLSLRQQLPPAYVEAVESYFKKMEK